MKRILASLLLCVFLLSGCSGTSSDMFAVPEMPEMQKALIDTVDSVLGGGFDYSEPRSGLNRQSLQLMDLDGDGEEEGIAFLRDILETYKTFIYIFEKNEFGFNLFDIIEGSESELYSVSYTDVLGKDGYEIIVEWGADGDGSHPVTIYNLTSSGMKKIFEISAKQYSVSDIDGDGKNEFLAVVKRNEGVFADIYTSEDGKFVKKAGVALSGASGKILRIKTGQMGNRKNGVYIEREKDAGVATDLIAYDGSAFVNMLPNGDVCASAAACADVTGDGVIELPREVETETPDNISDRCYIWREVSDVGKLKTSAFTYHAHSEGWYVNLPLSWSNTVSAHKQITRSGEVAVHFSTSEKMEGSEDGHIEVPLFTLYVIKGKNRNQYANEEGRFTLTEREDVLFAAQIFSESYLSTPITEEFVKETFKNIESEWFSEILFA